MTNRLHIITTCSNRKRVPVADALRARTLDAESVDGRFEQWRARLNRPKDERRAATNVYAGEHWQQSTRAQLRARTSGWDAELWVASAGHGLISSQHEIAGYAATLALREADAVATSNAEAREWWTLLGQLPPSSTAPRKVSELVRRDPGARYVLVLSGSYGHAMVSDLELAQSYLAAPGNLIVVSGGWSAPGSLRESHIEFDARLQGTLGGARQSLNARVAVWLLARTAPSGWDPRSMTEQLGQLIESTPPLETPDRERMTDKEVMDFIRVFQASEARPSASRGLRQLRDTGRACEQRRFGVLYRQVQND